MSLKTRRRPGRSLMSLRTRRRPGRSLMSLKTRRRPGPVLSDGRETGLVPGRSAKFVDWPFPS